MQECLGLVSIVEYLLIECAQYLREFHDQLLVEFLSRYDRQNRVLLRYDLHGASAVINERYFSKMLVRFKSANLLESSRLMNAFFYRTLTLRYEEHLIALTSIINDQIFWLRELSLQLANHIVNDLFLLALIIGKQRCEDFIPHYHFRVDM